MSHFVRLVDNDIIDFFIHKAEGIRYGIDEFLQDSPYLLCHRELDSFTAYLPEEFTDGFVIGKASCRGEKIVLDGADCGSCYLRSEGVALAFAESKAYLAILENHLQRPTARIYFPCPCKVHGHVCCKQTVPTSMVCAPCQENADLDASGNSIIDDVVAPQSAAILLQFLIFAFPDKLERGEFPSSDLVFCAALLSDLYHAEPVACDMKSMDEFHYIIAGEPTVRQHIFEFKLMADGSADHLLGKINLGCVIGSFAFVKQLACLFGYLTFLKFHGTHAVVALLAFLPKKFEIKEQLGNAVRDSHCQTFEPQYRLMTQMGMDAADFLYHASSFLMICIINNNTDILSPVVSAHPYLVPELDAYAPHGLAPVYIRIIEETVERILMCRHDICQSAFSLRTRYFPHSEKRKHQQALEHAQQPVDMVALAHHAYRVTFSHLDRNEDVCDILHSGRHIRIFEKSFDIREKWCNFVYRHGLSKFLFSTLNILIFCDIHKNPCRFLYPYLSNHILAKLKLLTIFITNSF